MTIRHGAWAVLALAVSLMGCARADDRTEPRTLKVGALDRTFILFVPAAVKADQPTPIVFAFHGSGGHGHDMLCCRPWAIKHGWLLVCPDGLDGAWHADSTDVAKSDSDFALVPTIVDALAKEFQIDRTRVYACGFSAGGGMTVRYGVHDAAQFAAIATVGHTLTTSTADKFPPNRPLPVLIMIGSKDPGLGDNFKAPHSLRAEDAARTWAKFDGCGDPTVTERPGAGAGDPTTIRETHYTGGKEGSEVALYWLIGIGHTWLRGDGPEKFDAGAVIFDFFANRVRAPGA